MKKKKKRFGKLKKKYSSADGRARGEQAAAM